MNRCPQRTIQSRRKLLAWSCVRALSGTQLCRTLCNPWTVAQQAPLSIDFSRQEYWSGLPCPPPGDLPDSGIKPASPAVPALAGRIFTAESLGKVSTLSAAAKSLQSCPTLCDPRDGSPPGFPVPGILQAGTLVWVAISFSNAWK